MAVGMAATLFGCGGSSDSASSAAASAASSAASSAAVSEAASSASEGGEAAAPKSGDKYRIGYVCKHQLDEFMQTLRKGAEEYAPEAGVDLTFMSTEKHSDVEKQVQLVDDMITQDFDAIILVATDPTALIPSIKKANDAGIPIVLVNDTIDDEACEAQGAHYETYIGTDNYEGGTIGGEFVAARYPDGAKVAIVAGTPGNPAGDARVDGFKEALAANNDKCEVVAEQPTDWSRDQGYSVMQNILTANPDIDIVYCPADLIALGAAEAISQKGLTDQIKVLGFDGSSEAVEAAKSGDSPIIGSVAQFPADMSKVAIDACKTILEGGTVDKVIHTDVKVLPEE